MIICGLRSGHDCSFSIMENGIPIIHHELERFSREKMKISDSLEFMFNVYPDYEKINQFVHTVSGWHGGIQSRYPETYAKAEKIAKFYGDMGRSPSHGIGHHQAHAANAFYTSNYKNALIITIDGGGEDFLNGKDGGTVVSTFTIWIGKDNKIEPIEIFHNSKINFGNIWSKFTSRVFGLSTGHPIGSQEGTVMAMAAYGDSNKFFDDIKYRTHEYFQEMIKQDEDNKFHIAAALQKYTEVEIKNILDPYIEKYKPEVICMAGGTIMNSVMNGKFYDWYPFVNKLWIPPTPYDAGCALGAAQYFWHHINDNPRIKWDDTYSPYLGYSYDIDIIKLALDANKDKITWETTDDDSVLQHIYNQKIISVYGEKSETGRRALGNRSILADPRNIEMKDFVNEKVKHRQFFRPFAPSILREDVSDWFQKDADSPYMSIVLKFKDEKADLVKAVLHKDGTARLQTVTEKSNKWYYNFIKKWKKKTGIPMLLNTSFNDKEPIVETPFDAIKCFLNTEIDYLYFYEPQILVRKI